MTYRVGLDESLRLSRVIRLGWEESRPPVQVAITGRFLVGVLLAVLGTGGVVGFGGDGRGWRIAVAAGAWLAAGMAVYVSNGMADPREDRANGSARPIASGRLARRGRCG